MLDKAINFIGLIISSFLGAGIASALVSYWLENKRIERVKKEEAITAVSDLLSEWVKSNYTGNHSNVHRWKLQSLYWKTILRLDKKILDVLIPLFSYTKDDLNVNEAIVKCRQILLRLPKPDITSKELNKWLPLPKKRNG